MIFKGCSVHDLMLHLDLYAPPPKVIVLQTEKNNTANIRELYLKLSSSEYSVYIMISSTSASCCIDFVSASRIKSDLIIKFGPTCSTHSDTNVFTIISNDTQDQYLYSNDIDTIDMASLFHDNKGNNDNISNNKGNGIVPFPFPNKEKKEKNDSSHDKKREILYFELCKKYNKSPCHSPLVNINRLLSQRQVWIDRASKCQKFGLILGQSDNPSLNAKLNIALNLINIKWSRFASAIHISNINPAKLANMVQFDAFVVIACPLLKLNQSDYNDIPIVYYDELAYVMKRDAGADDENDEMSFIQDFLEGKLVKPEDIQMTMPADDKEHDHNHHNNTDNLLSQRMDYHLVEKSVTGTGSTSFKGLEFNDSNRKWKVEMGQEGIPKNYKFID